jgi:hypothetical protein
MYKSELARLAEVSYSTFYRYLRTRREVLEGMGVTLNSQRLSPRAVKFICDDYDISLPDEPKKKS